MSPRSTSRARLTLLWALLCAGGAQASQMSIPDYPLFLTSTGVPPNVILTLDDSGSMSRAYTPDLCGASYLVCSSDNGESDFMIALSSRPTKSSDYNKMYYNPNVIYSLPVDATGASLTAPTFAAAYQNGYYTSSGTVNLGTSYQPTSYYWLGTFVANPPYTGGSAHEYMDHYSSDVRCSSNRCQYLVGTTWTNTSSTTWCSSNSACQSRGMPAYYYVYNSGNTNCNGTSTDSDCYTIKIVSSTSGPGTKDLNGDGVINASDKDERQNFANWYSFYRTRNLAAVGAASRAFARLPITTRVAWQALNSCRASTTSSFVVSDCEGWQTTTTNFSNAIKPFTTGTGGNKTNFYTWLQRLPSSGGTPMRSAFMRAGWYFGRSGEGYPYDNDLTAANSDEYSCRKNYHIAMTDGRWNTDSISSFGNADGAQVRPYKDSNSNTVADIAYYYWTNDLRTDLENNVPASYTDRSGNSTFQYNNAKNDPAKWQHMVNFTVGLGLTGFFAQTSPVLTWGGNTYAGSYADLVSGAKTWPTTDASGQGAVGNAADLWHAALDSRGKFYSVESPDSLVEAFQDIVNTINSTTTELGGGAGLAVSASIIKDPGGSTVLYQTTFDQNWEGSLKAIDFQGSDGSLGTTYWDAATLIPVTSSRKIYTLNGGTKQEFKTCSGDLKTALDAMDLDSNGSADNKCDQLLNWLRSSWIPSAGNVSAATWSSTSNTVTFTVPDHGFVTGDVVQISDVVSSVTNSAFNGTFTVTVSGNTLTAPLTTNPGTRVSGGTAKYATYRNHAITALGDIVNSDLVYTKNEDLGYADGSSSVTGGGSAGSYDNYVESTGSYNHTGKKYRVPAVYAGANDGMLHAFRADTGNADSGKELFAYVPAGVYSRLGLLPYSGYTHKYYVNGQISVGDVYVSSTTGWRTYLVGGLAQGGKSIFALDVSDPTGFDENDILWEYNSSASDTRLGLTYGKPQIAPLNNGQWAVVFGNGYNSSDEKAYLYVVNILDGTLIARLATNSSTSNGLSTPYLYDSDGDQLVDVAYAGDLQGNLWRFDLKSSGWQSQSGRLLFSAKNSSNQVQPITAQPVVSDHPTRGVLVYIGTGSYIATSDLSNTQQQSFYGIWDDPNTTATVLRSQLLQQTITSTVDNASSSWRVTSNNSIDWTTQRGWYMDLPASVSSAPTERVTNAALVIDGNTGTAYQTSEGQLYWRVIFTTVINYSDPCKQGGTGWIMELDLHTGGQPKIAVLDYNNDKNFTNADWYGAVDSNNDGEISDAERIASGAVSVSGKKLGNDGIPGSTTTVSYTPTGGGACTLYKETAMSTGAPEQTLNKCIPDEVTNRVRVYWQQIL